MTIDPLDAYPKTFRIFIGYDPKETVAYHVLAHSILRQARGPVSITPVARGHLGGLYTRPRGDKESTEFSMTRFLVPYLAGYDGPALFMDCDMLVQGDITELLVYPAAFPDVAVFCCQHDYTPSVTTKFLGQQQTAYPRKNWSSLMLFNASHCRALTPDYVNGATGLELHRFQWTTDDKVGALPIEWNWLIEDYEPNAKARILHWTNGGPWFADYATCEHAALWYAERDRMLRAA